MGRNDTNTKLISKMGDCFLTAWSEPDGTWHAEFESQDGAKSRTKMGNTYGDIVTWGIQQKKLNDNKRRITTARQLD